MVVTLPKTNGCPLKMDGWKMIHFLLGVCLFSGDIYVSFREGMSGHVSKVANVSSTTHHSESFTCFEGYFFRKVAHV